MTIDVLVFLLARVDDRHLVIETKLQPKLEFLDHAHEAAEYGEVRRMRFGPPLQVRKRMPVAQAEGLFERPPGRIDMPHIAVAVAADLVALIALELHALAPHPRHVP